VKKIIATFAIGMALAGTAPAGSALAQAKIQVGCTATSDCGSAMVAIDEGIFRKHGLEVEMTPIGINSNIPAAILSNSIQIGGPTSRRWGAGPRRNRRGHGDEPGLERQHHRLRPQRNHH